MPPSHNNTRDETIRGRKGIKPGEYIICIIAIRQGKDLNKLEKMLTVSKGILNIESYSDILDLLLANLAHINSKQSVIFLWALVI